MTPHTLPTSARRLAAVAALGALAWGHGPSWAQTTVVVAPASGTLGALLMSTRERTELDAARKAVASGQAIPTSSSSTAGVDSALGRLADPLMAINGVVLRQGHKTTVWINDLPLYGADLQDPNRQPAIAAGVVILRRGVLTPKGKPGEIIDSATGGKSDLLPLGAVTIRKATAK